MTVDVLRPSAGNRFSHLLGCGSPDGLGKLRTQLRVVRIARNVSGNQSAQRSLAARCGGLRLDFCLNVRVDLLRHCSVDPRHGDVVSVLMQNEGWDCSCAMTALCRDAGALSSQPGTTMRGRSSPTTAGPTSSARYTRAPATSRLAGAPLGVKSLKEGEQSGPMLPSVSGRREGCPSERQESAQWITANPGVGFRTQSGPSRLSAS